MGSEDTAISCNPKCLLVLLHIDSTLSHIILFFFARLAKPYKRKSPPNGGDDVFLCLVRIKLHDEGPYELDELTNSVFA